MTRLLVGLMILLLLAVPCRATSYRKVTLAELVGRSDVIVVGTLTEVNPSTLGVTVTRALAGKVRRHISLPAGRLVVENPGRVRVGDTQIFFLRYRKQELALVYDFAFKTLDEADEVSLLIDMRVDPKKYLADPRHSSSAAFLELLSFVFEKRSRVGKLDRPAAIKHFQGHLDSAQPSTVLLALDSLKRVGSKRSARVVIPLLRHADRKVCAAAARFLGWAEDPAALKPLCDALDAIKEDKEDLRLGSDIGGALGRLHDRAAAPALVRAIQRNVEGSACWALGCLGDESSFQPLLDLVERKDSMEALSALKTLVKRSNKKYEPWMDLCQVRGKGGDEWKLEWNRDDWLKWWAANKANFKVSKTAAELYGWDQLEKDEGFKESEGLEWPSEPKVEENDALLKRPFPAPAFAVTRVLLPPALGLLALIMALVGKDRRWVMVLAITAVTFGAFDLAAGKFGGSMMLLGINLLVAAGGGSLILGIAALALAWRGHQGR